MLVNNLKKSSDVCPLNYKNRKTVVSLKLYIHTGTDRYFYVFKTCTLSNSLLMLSLSLLDNVGYAMLSDQSLKVTYVLRYMNKKTVVI